ncbi:MAG: MOSC domain-containing protein [Myxococcota bacterium]
MTVGRAVGVLREIHRHPVKSMGGESIHESEVVLRYGVVGDRAWAIRDVAAGEIRGAKKIPALLGLGARYVEAPAAERSATVEIDLGDGRTVRSDDPAAGQRIGERLGRAVELCPRLSADAKAHYRRARPITDPEREIREASELLPSESIPAMSEPPVDLSIVGEYVSPPGTYFDFFDLHLVSHASLAHFSKLVPDSIVDARRFRPNFVVELDGPGSGEPTWPELAWVGRVLSIGELRFEITMPMMRCGMTTHAQAGLPKDPRIMRALVRDCAMNLGVGVTVLRAGHVRVGDAIRIAER